MDISTFYQSLPTSEHSLLSYDCQPVMDGSQTGQSNVMVVCQGVVRYSGHGGEQTSNFSQNFLLTKQGEVWKTAAGSLISDWIQPLFDSAISFYLLKMNILHLGLSSITCKPSANYRRTSFACVRTVYFFVLNVLKFQLLAV